MTGVFSLKNVRRYQVPFVRMQAYGLVLVLWGSLWLGSFTAAWVSSAE